MLGYRASFNVGAREATMLQVKQAPQWRALIEQLDKGGSAEKYMKTHHYNENTKNIVAGKMAPEAGMHSESCSPEVFCTSILDTSIECAQTSGHNVHCLVIEQIGCLLVGEMT